MARPYIGALGDAFAGARGLVRGRKGPTVRRGARGRRLALVGVAFACACGFASLRTGGSVVATNPLAADSVATGLVAGDRVGTPPAGAATPAGASRRPPVRDRAPHPMVASGSVSPPGDAAPAGRPRSFGPDVGTLAWQAVHGQVDGRLWHAAEDRSDDGVREPAHGRGLAGIGWPAIVRAPGEGMRVYRPMIAWKDTEGGRVPIADVRCMGLKPASVARRAARYEARIIELAMAHGISASLVKAVITEESCFDPVAVSPAGAVGLMQLMPQTAAWLKVSDSRDPDANLRAGIRYLASLKRRFEDTDLALAAYNAGPGNVRRYGGVPPFAETRRYIERVTAHHRRYVAATAFASR